MKIVGYAQHTGTPGHAATCMEIAMQHAQKDEVAMVFMNQGINKITNMKHPINIRPDVVVVYKSGKIDFIEVMSNSDTKKLLLDRVKPVMESFSTEAQGNINMTRIPQRFKK